MLNVTRASLGLLALASVIGGCHRSVGAAVKPKPITASGALGESAQAVCHEPGARGTPLVVDWPTQDRMDLEEAMLDGVAVVAYGCNKLTLLPGCRVEGSYRFLGLSQREEVIQLTDADEIRANLPLDGSTLAVKLGAELERGRALDLAMVHSGKLRTTIASVTSDQLQGPCEGATHIVRGAFVGAFAMAQGTRGHVGTVAEVFEAGLRASSTSETTTGRRDGDPNACKGVVRGSTEPPSQCTAAIRIELVAIGEAPPTAGTPTELDAQMACPEGTVVSAGKCTTVKTAPYRCEGDDPDECRSQCELGDPSSCAILGSMLEAGVGVARDLGAAAAFHEAACEANVAYSCSRLGVMFFYGNGVAQDQPLAAELFNHACSMGDGDGCNNLGMVLAMGTGVDPNPKLAAELLAWACNGGDAQGCFNAMVAQREGWGGSPNDALANAYGESAVAGGIIALFEQNCPAGSAYSCWGLGYMYQHGVFKPRDLARAKTLYQQSCPGLALGCTALKSL